MPRTKQQHIDEFPTLPHAVSCELESFRDRLQEFVGNYGHIVLELGCGKGAYTLALAERNPGQGCIGIDIQGERLWTGATTAHEHGLANALFARMPIDRLVTYFAPHSIDEIWITFPDPYPRKKQAKRRLTSPGFLELYKQILKPNGLLHFKTDDETLFDYSVESLESVGAMITTLTKNIYLQPDLSPLLSIQTEYEKKHIARGKQIHYLCTHF